ncbi:caspase domain-containing protein [Lysinibacillus sp. NPDC096418]|uniref:caspase family protein n=1 Tax=Lysinibacillus sp. NPDC096418 TaxID=3364138 RepID=UPI0037F7D616
MAYKAFLVAANLNIDPGFSSLPNTLNDVREIKTLLTEAPSNFEDENVQEYTGNIVKNRLINFALQDFFESAVADDVLFLFWAGHGHLYQEEGFLVPYDGLTNDTANTMIRMSDVNTWIENCSAKTVITLLDTCHSGAIVRGREVLRGLEITGSGKIIIAACQPSQYAYDRKGHGAFTDYLIQGLSGSAANADGIIDIYNLYSFITNKLSIEFSGQQIPVLHSSTLSGVPVEIKRITSRVKEDILSSQTEEINSSQNSFWLGSISYEYDNFIELSSNIYKMTILNPPNSIERKLRELNQQKNIIPFSFRNQAYLVKVKNSNIIVENSMEKIEVDLEIVNGTHSSALSGMAVGIGMGKSVSDDEIAKMRAERILLNIPSSSNTSDMTNILLETMIINPTNSSLKEVIPNLISTLQDENYSPTRIRTIAIGYLILTGTVEYIEQLKFHLSNGKITSIHFIGIRKQYYTNVPPYQIEIKGDI